MRKALMARYVATRAANLRRAGRGGRANLNA